jgi:hypothetical protein
VSERKYDPRQPYKVWLKSFDEWPEAERPTFTYRRTNGAESLQLIDAYEGLYDETKAVRERYALLFDALRVGLIGWTNQFNPATGEQVEFSADKLELLIDHLEADELLGKRMSHARTSAEDKKKSESQPSSSAG